MHGAGNEAEVCQGGRVAVAELVMLRGGSGIRDDGDLEAAQLAVLVMCTVAPSRGSVRSQTTGPLLASR